MSKEDVEKAVREAEQYAAEDKARRESVEIRNGAEQMAYQSERTIEEMGDKIDEADKNDLQAKIDALKEAMNGEDVEAIKAKQEELTKAFYAVSEKLYQAAAPTQTDDGFYEGTVS
jgi:molecular chaperone DnaK